MVLILILVIAVLFSPLMGLVLTRLNKKMDLLFEKIESQGIDAIPKNFQKKYNKGKIPREGWADLFISTQQKTLQYRHPYRFAVILNFVAGFAAAIAVTLSNGI